MLKKSICILLVLVMLVGVLSFGAVAADDCKYKGTPPSVEEGNWGWIVSNAFGLGTDSINYSELYPNNPPADVDTVSEKVNWIVNKCIESGATDPWDIALWLHDWLIYNANYDYSYTRYGADGVLLHGTGVCNSYAEAYILLLNAFGIENRKLSSPAMDHAWNLVKIDGEWCHIDCTWDDPGEGGGREHHAYFGASDKIIKSDHYWSASYYPACTSDINYYPIRMGYTVFSNKEEMIAALCEKAMAKEELFDLYYMGGEFDFPMREIVREWANTYSYEYGLLGVMWTTTGSSKVTVRIMGYKDEDNPTGHLHNYIQDITEPTCTEPGRIIENCICGDSRDLGEIPPTGHIWKDASCTELKTCFNCGITEGSFAPHTYTSASDTSCNICGNVKNVKLERPTMNMFRMYDPNSGEHFYTGSEVEKNNLIAAGWDYEGVGFTFPLTTGAPVYRLYDPITGEHLYTMNEDEKIYLVSKGWNMEGVAFNSAYDTEVPQYRLHNPNETRGAYHFTSSTEERDFLLSIGWEYQGIGFYSCWK